MKSWPLILFLSLISTLQAGELPVTVSEHARELHFSSLVIDGHNDLAWEVRTRAGGDWDKADISQPQPRFHTDIPRLRAGGVGAQFWSVYVPANTRFRGQSAAMTLEQIALVRDMIKRYPQTFAFADSAADIKKIRKKGKIACLIGIEGGHSIEDSLSLLRKFRQLGVKYMTLTHSDSLTWADSSTDKSRHDGLTKFGEEVVREMNRLGMIVDISHVSDATAEDAIRVSRAPVIASHSAARAVANNPRNIPDRLLKRIAKNGGVVMVNFYSGFVTPEGARIMTEWYKLKRTLHKKYPDSDEYRRASSRWWRTHPLPRGTIYDVIKHIDHIVDVAGIDHVGLGSDFDGVGTLPVGLEGVSTYPKITQLLVEGGYSDEEIKKVLGLNLMRVLQEVDATADSK